jgi:predicted metal-dependent peptidase
MSTNFDRMTGEQRLVAVNVDLSKHHDFAMLAGVACVGNVYVVDDGSMPTAATNGQHEWYGRDFIMEMNRKQLRYLKIHETLHKALHHCTEYVEVCKKHKEASGIAMDYVVNGTIEKIDPEFKFVERPTSVPPLVHPKYSDWSFMRVLKDLLQNAKPKQDEHGNDTGGQTFFDPDGKEIGGTVDEHKIGELTPTQVESVGREVADALNQGKVLQGKLNGKGTGAHELDNTLVKRSTNWREHLREFISSICEGHDLSRYSPPNKRFLPLGFVMPSHFSESTGEIIVACDTSGSMHGVYPLVFGEIARICEDVLPESVRVIWWEYEVMGEQVFKPTEYDRLGKKLQPSGGGGTRLSCVAEHIEANKLKPKAVIYLTDGYIESDYQLANFPTLFGVVDNDSFVPSKGKAVRIYS